MSVSRPQAQIIRTVNIVLQTGGFVDRRLKQWNLSIPAVVDVMTKAYDRALEGNSLSLTSLTSREQEVLKLLSEGMGVRDIAFHLSLSIKTIETYRQQIMEIRIGDRVQTRRGVGEVRGVTTCYSPTWMYIFYGNKEAGYCFLTDTRHPGWGRCRAEKRRVVCGRPHTPH